MTTTPWLNDTCSLVDAFRSGERSPVEEMEATLAAIEASALNAFSFIDADAALAAARDTDVNQPFGGVALGVKELDYVKGWPATEGSLVFADRKSSYTSTMVERAAAAGAIPVGLTTASEFGGLNVSMTKLNGITGNPWNPSRTAGGSSGGSASAVAGGLVPIATGGDGGGSIRIPAGFNGLVGMKGTAGRIPRGPHTGIAPLTVVIGCLARSVRDTARWYDVCNGHDMRDPYSLPRVDGWESGLGTHLADLRGKRVAIVPDHGTAVIRPELDAMVRAAGEALAADAGLTIVDGVEVKVPGLGLEWAMANLGGLLAELGDLWPDCKDDLTNEISFGMQIASEHYNLKMAANVETQRTLANEAMAAIFDQVDFLICATNPDAAYPADVALNTKVGDLTVGPENNGALTIPANIVGNPSCQVPIGFIDGLPVGMQIVAPHHHDKQVLDLAWLTERERPWPLVANSAPI